MSMPNCYNYFNHFFFFLLLNSNSSSIPSLNIYYIYKRKEKTESNNFKKVKVKYLAIESFKGFFTGGVDGAHEDARGSLRVCARAAAGGGSVGFGGDPNRERSSGPLVGSGKFENFR